MMKVDDQTAFLFLGDENLGELIHKRIETFGNGMWQKTALITVMVNLVDGLSYGIYVLEKSESGELGLRGTRISDRLEQNIPIKYQAALRGAKMAVGSDLEGSEVAEYQFVVNAPNRK